MERASFRYDPHLEKYVKRETKARINYEAYVTPQWQILCAFF